LWEFFFDKNQEISQNIFVGFSTLILKLENFQQIFEVTNDFLVKGKNLFLSECRFFSFTTTKERINESSINLIFEL